MTPKEFESSVHDLLRLQGWLVVPEKLEGHKKIDGLATKKSDFGKELKYLIECKYYEKPLERNQITNIYADYHPLIENKKANYILLVTKNGLTPSAITYIDEIERFDHITYKDLVNSIINFDLYNEGLLSLFHDNNLSKLYVPQNCEEKEVLLEDYIEAWQNDSETNKPIAILGGYGMGKSTLAKKLASSQAQRHKDNSNERIPILIKLEEISTESKLEGLLGSHFTTQSIIQNYNFELFLKLNEHGRFLIILDGFDEMKKTMSWDALLYNLQQLNRLVVKNSKVLLLGRPTAFMSDKEQKEALHGIRMINNQNRTIPDWPDYEEINISPFSKKQIEIFINKYIDFLSKDKSKEYIEKIRVYLENIKEAEGNRIIDITNRPVQMKMLMEILPFYSGEIDKMTIATLYSEFIDLVMRREVSKSTRSKFKKDTRRKFTRELAFWMWDNDIGTEVQTSKLSDSLFDAYVKKDEDFDSIKRDLMVGTILERKPPTGFYFPHRSFQEYLIAEIIVERIHKEDFALQNCPFITLEIQSFFIELVARPTVIKWKNYYEKTLKVTNENALELLRMSCVVLRIQYNSRLYKITTKDVLKRNSLIVKDIIGDPSNIKQKKKKKINYHKKRGVTPKKKY